MSYVPPVLNILKDDAIYTILSVVKTLKSNSEQLEEILVNALKNLARSGVLSLGISDTSANLLQMMFEGRS